ncbi:hypothetical protein IWX46DRAFT_378680 [Phyllosticta citricarpa]|uniref:Uncharacterized protein n=1 Tax=Phyllosticta citricarpa TaxID=55181 RepID=A0ABR1L9I4_9PEZI
MPVARHLSATPSCLSNNFKRREVEIARRCAPPCCLFGLLSGCVASLGNLWSQAVICRISYCCSVNQKAMDQDTLWGCLRNRHLINLPQLAKDTESSLEMVLANQKSQTRCYSLLGIDKGAGRRNSDKKDPGAHQGRKLAFEPLWLAPLSFCWS